MDYACELPRFLNDVRDHQMTVIRDNGVDRHLRFRRTDGSPYWFDLITWPGTLCIDGDCGTYVFARIEDMFDFFRMDKRDFNFSDKVALNINPGYWSEKLRASATSHASHASNGVKEFSSDLFRARVKDYFDSHFEDEIADDKLILEDPHDDKEVEEAKKRAERRAEIWQAIEDEVLDDNVGEEGAHTKARDFEHDGFEFQDFWEYDLKRYTFHFIWCLYAIVWGIQKYDQSKPTNNTAEKAA